MSAMLISGEKCTDPTEHDRVIEPIGDAEGEEYNVLDGNLRVVRESVKGLSRAQEIARSGLMTPFKGRLLFRREDGTLEHF